MRGTCGKPGVAAMPGHGRRESLWLGCGLLLLGLATAGCCGQAAARPAGAPSLSAQELQIIGHAAQFLQPPPTGGAAAIVFDPANPDSRADAEAIAGELGDGLSAGSLHLPVRVVPVPALGEGGFALVIAAMGAASAALGAALRSAHLLCVTADFAAVRAGTCAMGIATHPRIEIVLNHASAAACGIDFALAFRMMIREI